MTRLPLNICRLILLSSVLALANRPLHAALPWTRVTSPHYIVAGDIAEKRLHAVALDLERFRDGFQAFWGALPGNPPPEPGLAATLSSVDHAGTR